MKKDFINNMFCKLMTNQNAYGEPTAHLTLPNGREMIVTLEKSLTGNEPSFFSVEVTYREDECKGYYVPTFSQFVTENVDIKSLIKLVKFSYNQNLE